MITAISALLLLTAAARRGPRQYQLLAMRQQYPAKAVPPGDART
jgi:hypothetical protein